VEAQQQLLGPLEAGRDLQRVQDLAPRRRRVAGLDQRFAAPLAALRPAAKVVVPGLRAARTTPVDVEATAKADAGDFEAQLSAGLALFHASKRAEALPYFERAQALFPEFAGRESPHFYLAAIYKDQDRPLDAVRELQQLTAISDVHYRAQLELARLLEDQGDLAGAAASLRGALYISPFEPAVHERLAALDRKLELVARTERTLVELISTRHALRIEWYIVALIVFEIILTLYQLLFIGPH